MISLREIRLYICQRIQSSPSISSSSICFFIFFSATPFTSSVLPSSPWPDRERIHVGSTPESTRRPSPTCIDRNLQGRVLALPDEFVDVGLVRTETAIRRSGLRPVDQISVQCIAIDDLKNPRTAVAWFTETSQNFYY